MTEPTDERLLELAEKAQESVDRDGGQSAFSADVARLRMACSPDRIRALVEGKRRAEEALSTARREHAEVVAAKERAEERAEDLETDKRQLDEYSLKVTGELIEVRADRDLLRARVEELEKALQTELNELMKRNEGRTHYPGCEKEHPMCAAIGRIRAALPQPERGGGA
jgi:septal ring factor EnvC (AmiA/AmiB activator)